MTRHVRRDRPMMDWTGLDGTRSGSSLELAQTGCVERRIKPADFRDQSARCGPCINSRTFGAQALRGGRGGLELRARPESNRDQAS